MPIQAPWNFPNMKVGYLPEVEDAYAMMHLMR